MKAALIVEFIAICVQGNYNLASVKDGLEGDDLCAPANCSSGHSQLPWCRRNVLVH